MHALLLAVCLLAPQEAKIQSGRAPLPDAAKQREAEKTIRDLYKADYAKKSPADRDALVRTLLAQGQKSQDDPAAQLVFYREAQDLASQSGNVELAFQAVDATAAVFEVDAVALKNAALAAAAKVAKTPEELGKVADGYLGLAEAALKTDDYDNADKAAAGAILAARRANATPLMTRVTARQREIAELRAKFEKVKKATEVLGKDPENAAANLEVGLYLCFVKGEWDLGLPMLAKGSDPGLKALAAREVLKPTDAAARVEIADGWWDLAEKEKNEARQRNLYQRAMASYEKALPDATSLLLTKINLRIDTWRRSLMSKEGLSITFDSKPVPRGIVLLDSGDGTYQFTTAGGKPCVKLTNFYLYLKLADAWPEAWKTAEVDVEYYDEGTGFMGVHFDGVTGVFAEAPKSASLGSSKTWKTLTSPLVNPVFKGRQNAGADFRIFCPGNVSIRRIAIRLVQK
jgi:hypothetical protein